MTERDRVIEAYKAMAEKARYRPALAADEPTESMLKDPDMLEQEAAAYAEQFIKEENSRGFNIGVSNWETNRALVYVIEAARCLCGVRNNVAKSLLNMALAELPAKS